MYQKSLEVATQNYELTAEQKAAIEVATQRNKLMIAAMKAVIPIVKEYDGKVYNVKVKDALKNAPLDGVRCFVAQTSYSHTQYIEFYRSGCYTDAVDVGIHTVKEEGKQPRLDGEATTQELEKHINALEAENASFGECAERWPQTLELLADAAAILEHWRDGYNDRFIKAVGIPQWIKSAVNYNSIRNY